MSERVKRPFWLHQIAEYIIGIALIDTILFVHPKDMQDGKIPVSERDITTNVPFVPGVHPRGPPEGEYPVRD